MTLPASLTDVPMTGVAVADPETAPVPAINANELQAIGHMLETQFRQYVSDRQLVELRWLRNLRQYRGTYDPDVEKQLDALNP